jgi:hypothetical protein
LTFNWRQQISQSSDSHQTPTHLLCFPSFQFLASSLLLSQSFLFSLRNVRAVGGARDIALGSHLHGNTRGLVSQSALSIGFLDVCLLGLHGEHDCFPKAYNRTSRRALLFSPSFESDDDDSAASAADLPSPLAVFVDERDERCFRRRRLCTCPLLLLLPASRSDSVLRVCECECELFR